MLNVNDTSENTAKKNGVATFAIAGALALTLCAGGVLAYLTATDTKTNDFTVAEKLAITVVEPSWDATDEDGDGIPDAAQDIIPGQRVAKDPAIRNDTAIESYAIMQIQVPTKLVQLSNEDEAKLQELFTYEINAGWSEHGTATYDDTTGMSTHTYFYDTTLAGNATTTALFDEVKLVDLANDQMTDDLEKSIEVAGYAIQALGFEEYATAWSAYQTQNAQ